MENGILIFAVVWLLIYWLGSIALEATGLERSKARFQTLSALTGTGFTTRQAESVVNHPKRRRIVAWLILIGTTFYTLYHCCNQPYCDSNSDNSHWYRESN
jgi:Trk-type K+ transport system membrane component